MIKTFASVFVVSCPGFLTACGGAASVPAATVRQVFRDDPCVRARDALAQRLAPLRVREGMALQTSQPDFPKSSKRLPDLTSAAARTVVASLKGFDASTQGQGAALILKAGNVGRVNFAKTVSAVGLSLSLALPGDGAPSAVHLRALDDAGRALLGGDTYWFTNVFPQGGNRVGQGPFVGVKAGSPVRSVELTVQGRDLVRIESLIFQDWASDPVNQPVVLPDCPSDRPAGHE